MPRKDPTFSDADVIRIYCENLTESEKDNVDLFFYVYRPLIGGLPVILDLIGANVRDPKTRLILSLITRLWDAIVGLSPKAISGAIPKSIRKVVIRCLF
jgi:hypothetical protein